MDGFWKDGWVGGVWVGGMILMDGWKKDGSIDGWMVGGTMGLWVAGWKDGMDGGLDPGLVWVGGFVLVVEGWMDGLSLVVCRWVGRWVVGGWKEG